MFDADRPILTKSKDRLNRSLFANYLARCMLDHKEPESLVVGLYGGWGVGKTSLINLVIEELNFAGSNLLDEERPIILNFSAWSYSGQHQLIYSFFRRFSSTLRKVPNLRHADRIIHLLELYVSFFTQKPVPRSLRTKRSLWQKLTFQGREEVYAWESGRDLTSVKTELNELLRLQQRKIIIIIDNISRLYDDEIKQIFQIVKSMGDYANTNYLLAFDKTLVVRALNRVDENHDGELFLEKIVQLPFEVPPILQQDLEQIFADRLSPVLAVVPEDSWSIDYWADLYYGSLKFFFKNCRDITRYVNTLNFGYTRLRDTVNPVDFFALTAIEVFLPKIYFGIHENKDLFTDLFEHVYVLDKDEIAEDRLRCDEILSREQRVPREIVLNLLIRLFPRIRKIYHPDETFYHSDLIARKLKRICSPDLFDVYFRLSMQSGRLSSTEFNTLLSIASDADIFDRMLNQLNQDKRITQFLDLLDGPALKSVPNKHIQTIISALLDCGDLIPSGIPGPLCLDSPLRIHRIIHGLLQRLRNNEERFIVLQNAIGDAVKSIYILVYELEQQALEHTEESDTFMPLEFRDLTPEQLQLLRQLVASRIEVWADNGSLVTHPRLLAILYAWREWGDAAKCFRYVKKITTTDRGLLAFLTTIFATPIQQMMTNYEKNPAWEIYLTEIDQFIPHRDLLAHAKLLFENNYFEKLTEEEQLSLMIFLDLMKIPTRKIIPNTIS